MVFKLYIAVVSAAIISLFTPLWGAGFFIVPFLIFLILPVGLFNYRSWRKSQRCPKKSLSFGLISMETQKQNFKAINFVFSKCSFLQRFFKRMSITFDGMPAAINQSGASESDCPPLNNDYRYNSAYDSMSCNIYNTD